jgi:ABC-type Na+ efflux pump permease subunit
MQTITLPAYTLTIAIDNTGKPAAYVNDSQESSASGVEAILASYLREARNAGVEDELYAAIDAAR